MALSTDQQKEAIALLHKLDPTATELTLDEPSLKSKIHEYNKKNPSALFTTEHTDKVLAYQTELKNNFTKIGISTSSVSDSSIQEAIKKNEEANKNLEWSKQNEKDITDTAGSSPNETIKKNIDMAKQRVINEQKAVDQKKAALEQINLYEAEMKRLKTAATPTPTTANGDLNVTPGTTDPAKPKESPAEFMKRWNDNLSPELQSKFSMKPIDGKDPKNGLGIFETTNNLKKSIIEVTDTGLTVSPGGIIEDKDKAALVAHTAVMQGWPKDKPVTLNGGTEDLRKATTEALKAKGYTVKDITPEAEKKATPEMPESPRSSNPFSGP